MVLVEVEDTDGSVYTSLRSAYLNRVEDLQAMQPTKLTKR